MHDLALGGPVDVGIQKVPIIRGHATMVSMDAPVAITMPTMAKAPSIPASGARRKTSTANSSMTPKIARFTMSVRHADRSITNGSKGSITKRWIVVAIGMKTKTKRRNKANGNIQHRFSV